MLFPAPTRAMSLRLAGGRRSEGVMRRLGWAAALALLAAASGCGPHQPQPVNAFDGRLSDWTQEILADSPETATMAGVSAEDAGGAYNNRLDDRSPDAVDARRSAAL